MDKNDIIQELDSETSRLQQARQLLASQDGFLPMLSSGRRRRRHMSAEARVRISATQRARWAWVKAQGKKK